MDRIPIHWHTSRGNDLEVWTAVVRISVPVPMSREIVAETPPNLLKQNLRSGVVLPKIREKLVEALELVDQEMSR